MEVVSSPWADHEESPTVRKCTRLSVDFLQGEFTGRWCSAMIVWHCYITCASTLWAIFDL